MKIAVAGGVTGGHIFPAVAVLQHFEKIYGKIEVLYFATPRGLENREIVRLFPEAMIKKLEIRGLIRPVYSPANVEIIRKSFLSYYECKKELSKFKPDFSFITGGYVSVPVGFASQKMGIPTFIHEQNAIAGLANKLIAKKATKVFISFAESARDFGIKNAHKIVHTGNPVREAILKDKSIFERFGINPNKKIILVSVGSMSAGSKFINRTMKGIYEKLDKNSSNNIEFLHSCAEEKYVDEFNKYSFVHALKYIDDMHDYIANCDAMISRGGATTVAEIINYGTPSLVIPWSGASENHQLINAISIEQKGAGYYLQENEVNIQSVMDIIGKILDKNISRNIRKNLKTLKPKYEPAEKIFQDIISVIQ